MSATEVVEQIKALPLAEKERVIEWLLSDESELDVLFEAFDRMPRKRQLTEEETLALPRARSSTVTFGWQS